MAFEKSKYDQQYNRDHVKRLFIPFNDQNSEDVELREWLEQVGNKTQYIKQLIREDMVRIRCQIGCQSKNETAGTPEE